MDTSTSLAERLHEREHIVSLLRILMRTVPALLTVVLLVASVLAIVGAVNNHHDRAALCVAITVAPSCAVAWGVRHLLLDLFNHLDLLPPVEDPSARQ